ncbi:uncharacterized protein N7515_001321 [Penicillium bovifimosum]|uniref:HAT C-terminal dimerisation domain-containing protein n=1 Tax=Penicillium bovifimosum TaxID=126998 RepID=A0A9W9H9L9_9EURO|nr:uncharacterized protein N7515_001321 [Penicillium bovifimosum]KAJ5142534.1 hypothetical protein N7515_001321 [Penicillium bovifimosum]
MSAQLPQHASLSQRRDNYFEDGGRDGEDIEDHRRKRPRSDSARATSTANMRTHLAKHNISGKSDPEGLGEGSSKTKERSMASLSQPRAELDGAAFTSLESPAFQQIFQKLQCGPIPSTQTVHGHAPQLRFPGMYRRARTIEPYWELGHWVSPDFKYQERVLEFSELEGPPSGENMAEILRKMLVELRIQDKLFTITAGNSLDKETLTSELYRGLFEKYNSEDSNSSDKGRFRFQGIGSYITCLSHVLKLIVRDILLGMKPGDHKSAMEAYDLLQGKKTIGQRSALARLRIVALWISGTPQRRRWWESICQDLDLSDKVIDYDEETRWDSTHRMLRGALQAKEQIQKWIEHQDLFPPFSADDWLQLQQLEMILSKFNGFSKLVSKRQCQTSLAILIYHELNEMLEDAAAARDYLAIPMSGLSAERLFSRGMDLLEMSRESLNGETMRKMMLLRDPSNQSSGWLENASKTL